MKPQPRSQPPGAGAPSTGLLARPSRATVTRWGAALNSPQFLCCLLKPRSLSRDFLSKTKKDRPLETLSVSPQTGPTSAGSYWNAIIITVSKKVILPLEGLSLSGPMCHPIKPSSQSPTRNHRSSCPRADGPRRLGQMFLCFFKAEIHILRRPPGKASNVPSPAWLLCSLSLSGKRAMSGSQGEPHWVLPSGLSTS